MPRRPISSARSSTRTSRPAGTADASRRGFRPSRTATCTSATRNRSASTSASPSSAAARATSASTTRIPTKEDVEYVDAIKADVEWLGFQWDAAALRVRLFRAAVRVRRDADPRGASPTSTASSADEIRALPRHADRAGAEQPVPRPAESTRTSICSRGCGPASSPTAPTCCAPRSIWRRRTSTCATRRCTGSGTRRTIAPATRGASTRCTTSRIRCPTRSSASPTRCARSNSRIIGRCTTGSSTT